MIAPECEPFADQCGCAHPTHPRCEHGGKSRWIVNVRKRGGCPLGHWKRNPTGPPPRVAGAEGLCQDREQMAFYLNDPSYLEDPCERDNAEEAT